MRIRPAAGDEPAMPVQQRLRSHEESVPSAPWQHAAQRSEKKPIMRPEPRLTNLPAKDRQLVTEHENLQLVRALTPAKEHKQLQQAADDQVHTLHKQS